MSTPPDRRDTAGLAALLAVVATAVPAAVAVLPNTASYVMPQAVRDLGLSDGQSAGFIRACGLALPALFLTTPPAAALVRRVPAWIVLFAGLVFLLGAEGLGGQATSVPLVAAVRVAEGAGAGAVLPATLALACERRHRRTACGVWAGTLVASLLLATPLALAATAASDPDGVDWRPILRPYWWLGAVALIGTGLLGLLRLRLRPAARGVRAASAPAERIQLLLPVVPAAGFAFLAVVTTYDWSPGAQLILAACGVAGLLGLALAGSRAPLTGSPLGHAVVMIAAGLLTMPVTGPLAGLLGGRYAPLAPFAAAGGCAVLAALVGAALGPGAGRGAVLFGYGLGIVAIFLLLTMGVDANRWTLLASVSALGGGAGLAAGAAARHTAQGPALFGLSLCFPAVLCGHLIVGPLQIARVGAVTRVGGGPAAALYALTAAYRVWLVVAGVLVVVLAAVTAWASRGRAGAASAAGSGGPAEADGAALPAR